jgi:SAM-dependent methyltransferase
MSIYDHPELYAALFPPDVGLPEDVDAWFARALGRAPESVVEPACGPADWLVRFAARGVRVHGFDLSPKMVARARRALRPWRGTARVADMRAPSVPTDPPSTPR